MGHIYAWCWGLHVTAPHLSRAEGSCQSPHGAGAVLGEVHLEDSPKHHLVGVTSGCVVTVCLFQVDDLSTDKDVSSAQVAGEYAREALGTVDSLGHRFLVSLRGSFSQEGTMCLVGNIRPEMERDVSPDWKH